MSRPFTKDNAAEMARRAAAARKLKRLKKPEAQQPTQAAPEQAALGALAAEIRGLLANPEERRKIAKGILDKAASGDARVAALLTELEQAAQVAGASVVYVDAAVRRGPTTPADARLAICPDCGAILVCPHGAAAPAATPMPADPGPG